LAWTINYTDAAQKELRKLDRQIARRIMAFMDERIATLEDPRSTGKALTGNIFGEFWRYRLGDYRIVCSVHDDELCVLVVKLGNRSEVYE
jgi:mRNA interferase RelE/StbE